VRASATAAGAPLTRKEVADVETTNRLIEGLPFDEVQAFYKEVMNDFQISPEYQGCDKEGYARGSARYLTARLLKVETDLADLRRRGRAVAPSQN
jgi:hypothetical protein